MLLEVHTRRACEHVDCNLLKTIHNIWLQQFRKRGSCLYTTTSNENVWSFKQSSLYGEYLKGGPSIQGLNRIEFHLHRMSGFSNPLQMVVAITKYASSFTSRMSYLEGEEVFGSCKQCTNLPLGLKGIPIDTTMLSFFICKLTQFPFALTIN